MLPALGIFDVVRLGDRVDAGDGFVSAFLGLFRGSFCGDGMMTGSGFPAFAMTLQTTRIRITSRHIR